MDVGTLENNWTWIFVIFLAGERQCAASSFVISVLKEIPAIFCMFFVIPAICICHQNGLRAVTVEMVILEAADGHKIVHLQSGMLIQGIVSLNKSVLPYMCLFKLLRYISLFSWESESSNRRGWRWSESPERPVKTKRRESRSPSRDSRTSKRKSKRSRSKNRSSKRRKRPSRTRSRSR